MLSKPSVLRRRPSGIEKHYLLVQIHSDEFGTAADFQSRRPASRVVAAEHAGVDQEHFVAKARPHSTTFLHRVPYHKVCRLVSLKDLAHLRCTLFVAPPVVTAKPQRAINSHAEPIALPQELPDLSLALVVGRDTRLELSDHLRLKHTIDFLQIKEWQNQLFILQVLFRGIKCLDFVVDPLIHRIEFRLGQVRINSPVQEDDSINFSNGGMSSEPLTVFSLRTKRLALLNETCRMPCHPLCLGQLHGLGKLGE